MRTDSVEPNEPSRPEADEQDTNNQTGGGAKDPSTRKNPVEPPKK